MHATYIAHHAFLHLITLIIFGCPVLVLEEEDVDDFARVDLKFINPLIRKISLLPITSSL
jgi:hypothetical protein